MTRTHIKICGVCRVEDAQAAVRCGADAVGIVRATAAGRYVEIDDARAIATVLPAFVTPVLVYLNQTPEQIDEDLMHLGRPAIVQINGDDPVPVIAALKGVSAIVSIRMDEEARSRLERVRDARLSNLTGMVLESPGQSGGSGVGNDWPWVRTLQAQGAFDRLPPIIAAGGLTPETVAEVVRTIRPYAVDVSSGVEERKREKSEAKIAAFIEAVRQAEE